MEHTKESRREERFSVRFPIQYEIELGDGKQGAAVNTIARDMGLMGISFYLVWTNEAKDKKRAYIFYFVQLILNSLWSIIFFGAQKIFLALIEIVILWVFIFKARQEFAKISPKAAKLLLPYLAWVSFAALLNLSLLLLN